MLRLFLLLTVNEERGKLKYMKKREGMVSGRSSNVI